MGSYSKNRLNAWYLTHFMRIFASAIFLMCDIIVRTNSSWIGWVVKMDDKDSAKSQWSKPCGGWYCVAGWPNEQSCTNSQHTLGISMHSFPKKDKVCPKTLCKHCFFAIFTTLLNSLWRFSIYSNSTNRRVVGHEKETVKMLYQLWIGLLGF